MKLNPYLMFNGQCREAFEFYRQCLGGDLFSMTYGEAPHSEAPPTALPERILHTTLDFGENQLMGSDAPTDQPQSPSSTHLAIEADNPEHAEALFHSLGEGGRVTMPLSETFWAYKFGMCTDRFGVPWMVSAGKPMDGAAR